MIYDFYQFIRPLIFRLDPETAHGFALTALKFLPKITDPNHSKRLALTICGMNFKNPIGLAAGFDKQCEARNGLFSLGFGFVELGGVVPFPQQGNPRPRVFRLPADEAIINRFGLNSDGLDIFCTRLKGWKKRHGIVGINIGANKDSQDRIADYATCIKALNGLADFLTINVSSPNTPGLRDLQGEAHLDALLGHCVEAREEATLRSGHRAALVLKIAPDIALDALDAVVETAQRRQIDALAISNTTISRPVTLQEKSVAFETGGLSGKPLFSLSTYMLAQTYCRIGRTIPLIGVGGVDSGEAAWDKILAGATLVQLYTALIYKGPGIVTQIINHISKNIAREKTISDYIGIESESVCRNFLVK